MEDLISREAVADAINGIECTRHTTWYEFYQKVMTAVEKLPPAEHGTNLAEDGTDLISRAAAQTELQLSARRYTVAHEAHGEGRVVWSEDLISVSDAMDVLRKIPSAQPEIIQCKDCKHYWIHKCMDSMPIERCDLEQTLYDAEHDFCSLAERREVTT